MSLTGLLFVLAFAAGCLMALVRHPVFGLMTYVGVFYLHPPSRWWGQGILLDIRWSLIAAGVTLLALLLRGKRAQMSFRGAGGPLWAFVGLIAWIAVQSPWALDPDAHRDLLTIYLKFIVVFVLIYKCIETEQHLRWFLWAHVLGCFYLGWIAFTRYKGGRFEDFGGPGLAEANAAALQLASGIFVAGSLFLAGRRPVKAGLLGVIPLIVNGLITTISRSGFLAAGIGGVIYNLFTPGRFQKRVRILSVLAAVLFLLLTNDTYWSRVETVKYRGEEVEGVDTGAGRLVIIEKQWLMFQRRPLGCGHMCTTVLSPSYMDASMLSRGGRASHNTFMTMLVDHGVPGGLFYMAMLVWIYRSLRTLKTRLANDDGFLGAVLPAAAAALAAITVADMFAQYPKFEGRIWFIAILMVMLRMTARRTNAEPPA